MKRIKYLFILGGINQSAFGFFKVLNKKYDFNDYKIFIPWSSGVLEISPYLNEFKESIIFLPNDSLKNNLKYISELYDKADSIIAYGLFCGLRPLIPIAFNKKYAKKFAWIEWGGDLYLWKRNITTPKDVFANYVNYKVRQFADPVGLCFEDDLKIYKRDFNTKAEILFTPLISHRNIIDVIESSKPNNFINDGVVRIQVGHNAFQFGNHIRILDMLEKFKDENIQVILPMAYGVGGINGGRFGGINYKKSVYNTAKFIFGKKSLLFSKGIPLNNFYSYLWNLDIVVFDLYRQAGLGNILPLLYMNKKVFLPKDTIMYNFFVDKGIKVYDTNTIPNMSYDEFIAKPEDIDKSWIRDFYDPRNLEKYWDKFIEVLSMKKGI